MHKTIIILLALTSCLKTEVLNAPMEVVDSVSVKQYRPSPPRPPRDTTRIPITFDPSVVGWDETEIEL